jgi:cytochrome c-type biogenesis protein CcsB
MYLSLLAAHPIYGATMASYFAAFLLFAATWRSPRALLGRLGTAFLSLAFSGNALFLVLRGIEAGRPPFRTAFESLVFLACLIALFYLVAQLAWRTGAFGAPAALGSLVVMLVALAKWDPEIVPLPPALQSAWFIPHVFVYFLGYAALFFAAVVSAVQLYKPTLTVNAGTALQGAIELGDLAHAIVRFGFVMLTFGMLAGSFWAKSAWGDYWVWDPKENWSLVTWLIYAGYLHLRYTQEWRGKKAAWLAIAGFALVLFTYLGMELLPTAAESAHVYANGG